MSMVKKVISSLIKLSLLAFVMVILSPIQSVRADGKTAFIANKCNKCHEGAGIALLPKDTDADADGEAVAKVQPPKLDGMGAKLKKDFGGDKAKIAAFLRKEIATPEGNKHKIATKLDDAGLGPIIDWLLTL